MASIEELQKARLEKLKKLKSSGVDPYPARSERETEIKDIIDNFEDIAQDKEVKVAGRITALREHGGSVFIDVYDGTGKIQGFLKKDILEEKSFNNFLELVDIGDFIDITGTPTQTKRGEKSILATSWRMLTKSLRPLPEKWAGLKNVEEKLRKRYLDILFNEEVRELFIKKSVFWGAIREFMVSRGFLEVETPALEVIAGGADARPFITHHDALDIDLYLRISAGELWQKKLMVAGYPKVFELGRIFRNEGMSSEHLQDYTQMEFYWAYADYNMGMNLVEEMYKFAAEKTFGTLEFEIRNHKVNLADKWEKYDYREVLKRETGIDALSIDLKEAEKKIKELKIDYDGKDSNLPRAVDVLWKYARKSISGPGFLVNVPVFLEPLAKRHPDDKDVVERFQVIIAGSENGKGYSELNDPIDQRERFEEQQALRDAGDKEAQMMDAEFVEALEYGMPPTCGFGVSERLFAFLANKPVREQQIFPLMKPEEK